MIIAVPGPVENLTASFGTEGSYDSINRTYFLAIQIAWDPPSPTSGIILGHYYSLQETDGADFIISRTNTSLTAVEQNVTVAPYTNYTVAVIAFTAGGDGPQEMSIILSPEAGIVDVHLWQCEHYSVAYFDCVTVLKALYF